MLLTWLLSVVWLGLMSFGIVSAADPEWLQELSRPGIEAECRAYKEYGDTALRQHKYNLAAGQYERALEIKPDATSVWLNLGITYMQAGNLPQATYYLNQALEMDASPSLQAAICFNLGELNERLNNPAEALRCYRQALDLNIRPDMGFRKVALLHLAAKEFEKTRDTLQQSLAAQLDPTLPYKQMLHRGTDEYRTEETHLAAIAELLARETRPEDLARYDLEFIRRLQQTDREVAKTHCLLGQVYAQLGDGRRALEHLEASLRIWPDYGDARTALQQLRSLRP
ncbi:MAG: tetratricopeptide repeat protein [Planctomycetes bacterium]|nr:tetratricopeptide repeat protein [Planctomycetota bacterium]